MSVYVYSRHVYVIIYICVYLTTSLALPPKLSLSLGLALFASLGSSLMEESINPSALLRVFTVFTLALNNNVISAAMTDTSPL